MARTRDEQKFNQSRESLLAVGQDLFINSSFKGVGLNDILKTAGIPKGSFYHYFESKEDFGLQVVELYANNNITDLKELLADKNLTPYQQLKTFFENNLSHFEEISYCQGCLMANLSQELADVNENLRCKINELTQQLVNQVASCLEKTDDDDGLNLGHLPAQEAAQVLMNSWQGAIMKMKLQKNNEPLEIFMKFFFTR